jgi:hypothetical protein
MPIFGQVWLWSSLAFLLGALLCWGLVALPARRRVSELEAELAGRYRRRERLDKLGQPERPGRPGAGRPGEGPGEGSVPRHRALDKDRDELEFEPDLGGRRPDPRGERRDDRRADRRDERRDLPPMVPKPPPTISDPLIRAYAQPDGDQPPRALPTREPGQSVRPGSPVGFSSTLSGLGSSTESDASETELADEPGSPEYFGGSSYDSYASPPMDLSEPLGPPRPGGRGWFDDDPATTTASEPLEAIRPLHTSEPSAFGLDSGRTADTESSVDNGLGSGLDDGRLVDDEAEAPEPRPAVPPHRAGTIFTQHTHPIPGETIREIDESALASAGEPADALVDDLADEDAPTTVAGPSDFGAGLETGIRPTSEPGSDDGTQGHTEVMPAVPAEPPAGLATASGLRSGAEPSAPATESRLMPGVTISTEGVSPLPKRVPGRLRAHTPFGVEVGTEPEPEPTTAPEPGFEATRALFEPVRPAEESPVVPPPHRVRGEGNGRGPFGPGSAMPLPGGGSPSPEFTIKASVSALRYCTPESPQFGRTVAEVWFKTPADAERVGFRPVG